MSGVVILILRALLAIILYAFLGTALFTIWRQLRTTGHTILNRAAPPIILSVNNSDTQQKFTSPEVIIGRDPNCEFSLSDDAVSSHHARLNYHHNQWWLEDLNSTNGTFLNGAKLTTPTIIISNDEIGIGSLKILVEIKKA